MGFKKELKDLPKLQFYKDLDLNLIISYRYRKEINKGTILFLHGFNGNSKSWAYQFNFLRIRVQLSLLMLLDLENLIHPP